MPNLCKTLSAPISWKSGTHFGARLGAFFGVKTLRTQDTSDPRHFGTSAEVSERNFGTALYTLDGKKVDGYDLANFS